MLQQLRAAQTLRRQESGNDHKLSLSFLGNEMAGETGEACNVIKKLDREAMGMVGSRAKPEDLLKELADVVICADLIAMEFDWDLGEAVKNKFNETSDKRGLRTRIV